MRRSQAAAAVALVVALLAPLAATAATTATAAPRAPVPKAADVGISDTEIHLAVIADVENSIVPGLFKSGVDAMRAWAKIVNRQGGIARRRVVIDFIDSKLNPNESRNATITACSQDFAMVGSEALFLTNVDDMVGCKDAQGNPTGLPDMAGLALDVNQRCSPVTYIASGDTAFCPTRNDHPQTYHAQQGDARFYLKKDKDLHGIFTLPSDLKATRNSEIVPFQAAVNLGIKKDGQGFYDVSASSQQSALTPIVQVIKSNNSTFVYNGSSFGIMVLLRREATLQGVNTVRIWACNQGCYDSAFLKQGGADVEGTYSILTTLPFLTEYKSNPTLKALVKELGGPANLNANAVGALTGALLFQDAAEKAVANGGTLTRKSLLDAVKTEHRFDAKGIIGPTDVGDHQPPGCIVMTQVKNGQWVRVSPAKPGTFDCNKQNIVLLKMDLS
ncbi:MAG TPA: ABC transporter substrate-binding protein [Acidimicrobiia bacterium]|nr:ABC transporter substrate-binding protein [Acidimicrobiia bacterium]